MLALVILYFIWFYRERPRFGSSLAAVLGSVLLGGFFVATATSARYGGLPVDPATAALMPNKDTMFGLPLNGVVFGVAWLLLLVGTMVAKGEARASG